MTQTTPPLNFTRLLGGIADGLPALLPFYPPVLDAMPFLGEFSVKDLDGLTVEDLLDGG